jgi:hypothetical protein
MQDGMHRTLWLGASGLLHRSQAKLHIWLCSDARDGVEPGLKNHHHAASTYSSWRKSSCQQTVGVHSSAHSSTKLGSLVQQHQKLNCPCLPWNALIALMQDPADWCCWDTIIVQPASGCHAMHGMHCMHAFSRHVTYLYFTKQRMASKQCMTRARQRAQNRLCWQAGQHAHAITFNGGPARWNPTMQVQSIHARHATHSHPNSSRLLLVCCAGRSKV